MRIGTWISLCLALFGLIVLSPGRAFPQAGSRYFSHARPDSLVPPLEGEAYAYLEILDLRGGCNAPDSVFVSIWYSRLDSDPIGASIHRGHAGQNGEEVISLVDGFFAPNAQMKLHLDSGICEEMWTGEGSLYFIVNSIAHPEGAVRGQVWFETWSPVAHATWGRVKGIYR